VITHVKLSNPNSSYRDSSNTAETTKHVKMTVTSLNGGSIRTTASSAGTVISRASVGSSQSVGGGHLAGTAGYVSANQQHVDYILVAEFSIDKGSIMEHQYPNPISGDEQ